MPTTLKHNTKREKGAVLIEFGFVVPFLVLMISGIYELGRYFSQVSWISQTAYQVALVGGLYASNTTTDLLMQGRYQFLRDNVYSPLKLELDNNLAAGRAPAPNNVRATITGRFKFRWGPSFFRELPLTVAVEGPRLVRNTGAFGNTDRFCNWDTVNDSPVCP